MYHYIGVDVGTTSVRAALVKRDNNNFKLLQSSVISIQIWNDTPNHFEQSGEQIWMAVGTAVKDILGRSALCARDVNGVGFDATCSLVALDQAFQSISVTASKEGPSLDNSRLVLL